MRNQTITGQWLLLRIVRVRLVLDYGDLLLDHCRSCRCGHSRCCHLSLCKAKEEDNQLISTVKCTPH